jgi:hypothetical protein
MRVGDLDFEHVTAIDFEFYQPDGEVPAPLCAVAIDATTGKVSRWWQDQLYTFLAAPYPCGLRDLVVCFYASAEMGCHLQLGWALPENILDLYIEFRALTNGYELPHGRGLLGALLFFGLPAIDGIEKSELRMLARRGGPYTEAEQVALLDYCETDVHALVALLPKLFPC